MQAVILAAGLGTRLRPITEQIPKCLVPVQGKPLLTHILESLPQIIDEIVIVRGYLGEMVEAEYGHAFNGHRLTYVTQPELTGSGGALLDAEQSISDEPFMVLHGDNLYAPDDLANLSRHPWVMAIHHMTRDKPTMTFGLNGRGEIIEYHMASETERQAPIWVCTGAYVLDRTIFGVPPVSVGNDEFGLPQMLLSTIHDRPLPAVRFTHWLEVNTLAELSQASQAGSFDKNH